MSDFPIQNRTLGDVMREEEQIGPYRVVQGAKKTTGEPHWYVADMRRRAVHRRISVNFPNKIEAERCRDVLLADDKHRAEAAS